MDESSSLSSSSSDQDPGGGADLVGLAFALGVVLVVGERVSFLSEVERSMG